MKKSFVVGVAALAFSVFANATEMSDPQLKARSTMVANLEFLRNAFHTQYAPADWKKQFAQWDIDSEINQAQESITNSPSLLGTRDYQYLLSHLFQSARDYHTSISFFATEAASLPFSVKGAEGRYFIVYINREKLSKDTFPFEVGDELVTFGDKPVDEAVKDILSSEVINSSQTDQERAEQYLTNRSAARGFKVPHGPITIGVKPKGSDRVFSQQLIWDYTREKIAGPLEQALSSVQKAPQASSIYHHEMIAGDYESKPGAALVSDPYALGAKKTFTPDLGKKIWQSSEEDPFYAYIFQNTDKKLIGYIRIPSYEAEGYAKDSFAAVENFRKVIAMFESTTDALVIDQVNNPGGSVSYLYSLVSMLTDQPIKAPRHRMMITQSDVKDASDALDEMAPIKSDADAQKILNDKLDGYPASYELVQFKRSYCDFILSEFRQGHTLTSPYWIEGVDQINPAKDHFTKPILLLINGLDFSGGDFFPATLQDNKRVTTFGTRTAGAGGYVLEFTYPNTFGVAKFRLTGSIAERADLNPIENLGVKPDVEYSISADDLQNDYRGYIQAIQNTLTQMTR